MTDKQQPPPTENPEPEETEEKRPKRKMSIEDSIKKINTEYSDALDRLGKA